MDSDLIDLMMKWRHALHACPETAFEEVATADLVAGVLRQYGFEVHGGIGRTGVVGTMTRSAGPAIRLTGRAWTRCRSLKPIASRIGRNMKARCMRVAMTATLQCCSAPLSR